MYDISVQPATLQTRGAGIAASGRDLISLSRRLSDTLQAAAQAAGHPAVVAGVGYVDTVWTEVVAASGSATGALGDSIGAAGSQWSSLEGAAAASFAGWL